MIVRLTVYQPCCSDLKRRVWGWLVFSVALCVGWHIVLYRTPTDGLTGTVNFADNQFQLRYWGPPESQWADAGISVYRSILRVDARSVADWLSLFGAERSS